MLLYLRCKVKKKVRVDTTLSAGMRNFFNYGVWIPMCIWERRTTNGCSLSRALAWQVLLEPTRQLTSDTRFWLEN